MVFCKANCKTVATKTFWWWYLRTGETSKKYNRKKKKKYKRSLTVRCTEICDNFGRNVETTVIKYFENYPCKSWNPKGLKLFPLIPI